MKQLTFESVSDLRMALDSLKKNAPLLYQRHIIKQTAKIQMKIVEIQNDYKSEKDPNVRKSLEFKEKCLKDELNLYK